MSRSKRRPEGRANGTPVRPVPHPGGTARPIRGGGAPGSAPRRSRRTDFVLYVEGPRDQSLLEAWAQRLCPPLARTLATVTVILGGCQPARAAEHFRDVRSRDDGARGLVVLDRDVQGAPRPRAIVLPGLDYYTWGRRHIESYLLVPEAIRRSLRLPPDDARVERWFRTELPREEEALGALDAKPLFAARGELEQLLGRPVRPAQVARSMRADEIHRDVHELLDRLREALDLGDLRARLPASRAD